MSFLQDARHAIRVMRATPGVTPVLILTMALGVGANTALFSIVYGVLFRPLPYAQPERLMRVRAAHVTKGVVSAVSYEDVRDFEREERSFQHLAISGYWTFNLTGQGVPQRLVGVRVSGEFFTMLGVAPLLGRTVLPSDDRPGGGNVVVLSYGLWHAQFGGDQSSVGRVAILNGVPTTIIGVMPASFRFPAPDVQMWAPLADEMTGVPRNSRFMAAFGRLRDGVTPAEAEADLNAVASRLAATYPDTNTGWGVRVDPAREVLTQDIRGALLILFGAVVVVLLIACANVANLLSARAAARQRESAIRLALGAGARRLAAQHLTEALMLATAGGALGLALAWAGVGAARRLAPPDLPRVDEIAIDAPILAFTLAGVILSALLFSLAPARQAWRVDVAPALNDAGRASTGGRGGRRLRAALVVGEIALAVPLLVGGGLLVRSFARVLDVDPGFRPERLVAMDVFLVGPKHRRMSDQKSYVAAGLERIGRLPGIEQVAAISQVPFIEMSTLMPFRLDGSPTPAGESRTAHYRAASASYFATMGMTVKNGRGILESDTGEGQPVGVVNQTMARRYWGGRNPVGARIMWDQGQARSSSWITIVGVVNDIRTFGLEAPEEPAVYIPFTQRTLPFMRWMTFVARARGDAVQALPMIRAALLEMDPDQPVHSMTTLEASLGKLLAERRFNTLLMALFAAAGVILAAVGLFGMLSFAVAQRTREIGVRMALGARPADVVRLVLRDGARLTAAGLAAGGLAALAATRALASLLFGVEPADPVTFAAIAAVVVLVALTASYGPARRAAAVDPIVALRE